MNRTPPAGASASLKSLKDQSSETRLSIDHAIWRGVSGSELLNQGYPWMLIASVILPTGQKYVGLVAIGDEVRNYIRNRFMEGRTSFSVNELLAIEEGSCHVTTKQAATTDTDQIPYSLGIMAAAAA